MKAEIIKNSRLTVILFVSGLSFLSIGLALRNHLPENTDRHIFIRAITIVGVVMGALGGIQGLMRFFYHPGKGKNTSETKQKEEKEAQKKVKEQLFKSMSRYDDAQQSFRYLSDDTLLLIYDSLMQKKLKDLEHLALEKELMNRGLIKNSPMNDKLYSLKQEAFVE
jgi:hypothetical protein